MVALLCLHLLVWLLIGGLRFPADLDLVVGMPVSTARWAMVCGVLLGLGFLAIRNEIAAGRAPWRERERAVAWLLLVVVPGLHWSVGDAVMQWGIDAALLASGALLGWWTILRRPQLRTVGAWWGTDARTSVGVLAFTVVAGAALLLAFGVPQRGPLPWLTYPVYALVQLGLLLELPERLWARDGVGPRARVAGVALLFAMVHGPNPLVLMFTATGMLVWASARIAGAGLLPLAISMGLLGATVAQSLPESATDHMRVGPGYVDKRAHARAVVRFDARVQALASEEAVARAGSTLADWLDLVHSEVFGAPIDDVTCRAWTALVNARQRAYAARVMLESTEYRRAHGIERLMEGSDRSLLYSTFRPWHPAQEIYAALVQRAQERALDEDHAGFMAHAYQTLLARVPATAELTGWPSLPSLAGREEIVRRFLLQAGIEDPATWRRPTAEISWPRIDERGRLSTGG